MAIVTEYFCEKCGFKHEDGAKDCFYYDEESGKVVEFMLLMMTCEWFREHDIAGYININYCKHCNKLVKTYRISQTGKYSDEDAKDIVKKAIKYKPFQKHVKMENEDWEHIICPNCNEEISSRFTNETHCPKCGGKFIGFNVICYD